MHACKNNCWFSAKNASCSPCDKKKKQETIIEALRGKSLEALTKILKDPSYGELIRNTDMLDTLLKKIYILNKDYLEFCLYKIQGTATEAHLISRIHTHSNTLLCPVVSWMIRNGLYDSSINISCLRCMSHLIRYGTPKEADNVKYSIQFDLYGPHHINIRAAVSKNKANLPLLTDMGNAIIERGEMDYLLAQYSEIVRKNVNPYDYHSYTESLREHPLLHNSILESDDIDSRKKLYKGFRARKDPYWEELIAKGMHPCRVIQWCMTEEEKEGFSQIPPYIFLEGRADWDIEF
jgi:hypothetical protein